MVFAVDASTFDRCDAECSPERGFYYSASKHSAGQPIVAGWNYQWICQLDWAPDSWTAPLDAMRITVGDDPTTATVDQVRRLVGLLPNDGEVPLFVFDAGYDPIAIGHDLAGVRVRGALPHPRRPRLLWRSSASPEPTARDRRAPSTTRASGGSAPTRRPGRSLERSLVASDPRYGTVTVTAWHGVHPRICSWPGALVGHDAPPIVKGSVIRVEVEHLPEADRPREEDALAVVVRRRRARPRPVLACLPPALRHRAHLPVREGHPRLDDAVGPHARAGRPLDLARRWRVHPAPPRPRPRRRSPAPLGAAARSDAAHPHACATGVSATSCNARHASQSTEIPHARSGTPERDPKTAENPLSGDQKGSLNRV